MHICIKIFFLNKKTKYYNIHVFFQSPDGAPTPGLTRNGFNGISDNLFESFFNAFLISKAT